MKTAKKDLAHAQIKLFQQIALKLSPVDSMAEVLSEILEISTDAAYRRLRGEKLIDIAEAEILSRHFAVSLDSLFENQQNTVLFNYSPLNLNDKENYLNYMEQVKVSLQKAQKLKGSRLTFSATDIPVYHFMPFKELTIFKLYSWNSGLYGTKDKFEAFYEAYSDASLFEIYDDIEQAYKGIDSVEIWTKNTVEPILSLINYYWQTGCFVSSEMPLKLLGQIEKILENISEWSSLGKKGNLAGSGKFDLHLSEIALDNNFVLLDSEQFTTCMLKLFTINSITTNSTQFCNETRLWFNNLLKKSQCISRMSEKEHYQFFSSMRKKVQHYIEKVEIEARTYS